MALSIRGTRYVCPCCGESIDNGFMNVTVADLIPSSIEIPTTRTSTNARCCRLCGCLIDQPVDSIQNRPAREYVRLRSLLLRLETLTNDIVETMKGTKEPDALETTKIPEPVTEETTRINRGGRPRKNP